jgi:exodeoxyribonuclease V alpha subunit
MAETLDQISGMVERIVFTEERNGFTVARLKEVDKSKPTTIVGTLFGIKEGENLSCSGTWKFHTKFGKQFDVDSFSIETPTSLVGVQKYLESGLIKGIGPSFAKKIVDTFKEQTLRVIEETPEKLLSIPGLGRKKLTMIEQCFSEQKSIRKVMIFLQSHGVSTGYAQKIYKRFQDQAIEKVKENPYELAKEISGIGFKIADKIAGSMGFQKDSPRRITAGLSYLLWELSGEGHTCYPRDKLLEKATEALEVESSAVDEGLTSLVNKRECLAKIIGDNEMIWLHHFYHAEEAIATELQRLTEHDISFREIDKDKAIIWVEEKLHIQFAPLQKEAVIRSIQEKVHIITGGPGTGKSTITKGIIAILEKVAPEIILCAPTGRAAKRLSEITRRKAFTIHALLEFDPAFGSFKKNAQNPLSCDLIIIDEASMIDTMLMLSLLEALPDQTKLLLIGDIDQLPSVGPGYILSDLISSMQIPVTRLSEIFRQAKGSLITVNAHKINQGEFPILTQKPQSDFHFYEATSPEEVVQKIIDLNCKELPQKKGFDPLADIQILSPMRKGPIGTIHLNHLLQKELNPAQKELMHEGRSFHMGDKVIQLKNNYNKKIYNGDIGFIRGIYWDEQMVIVSYDGMEVEYDFSELDEIALAYAISIHKYQGSEAKCILVPVHTSHFIMLHRNLLYTAATRGKKFVAFIGLKKALMIAVKNEKTISRYTGLQHILKEVLANTHQNQ